MKNITLSDEEQQELIDALEQWINNARDDAEDDDFYFGPKSARMTALMKRLEAL